MIKKILSILITILLFTGCNDNQSNQTPETTPTGEEYILSLVDCDDAVITRGFMGYDGHKGVDVAAPEGTRIYAADSGTVDKMVIMNMGYGNHIIIDHGTYKTLYAHCQAFADIKIGDNVSKGDVIGYVGNTGNSTGAHLHFEVITDNGQQDPETWFE